MKKLYVALFILFSSLLGSSIARSDTTTTPVGLTGKWTQGTFTNSAGSRDYFLYTPKSSAGPLPLYVMLVGCTQDVPSFAANTGMRELGDRYGFAVLYPVQPKSANIYGCWNWFLPENNKRGTGEPSIIVGMVGQIETELRVDTHHVYVGGISAGGALASSLIACYSDVFSGALIHSGIEFEAASTPFEGFQVMSKGSSHDIHQSGIDAAHCTGSGARINPIMIVHGTKDMIVNPINSTHVLQQFTKMNDLLDDGLDNDSQTTVAISTQQSTSPAGETYTTETYGGHGKTHILNITVQGMGHAWSGAHQAGDFADPNGPDASKMMIDFMNSF